VVFVHQGRVDQGPLFFDRLFPGAVAIADPHGSLYDAFDVERGGVAAMFGPDAWRCGLRALRQGHLINRPIGDPWTLPTIVAVRDRIVLWEHRGVHAGDHPDVAAIPRLVEAP
jgi:hypothetical protein